MNKSVIALTSFSAGVWLTASTAKRLLNKKTTLLDLCGRVLLRFIELADDDVNTKIWDEFAFEIVTRDMTPKDPRRKN